MRIQSIILAAVLPGIVALAEPERTLEMTWVDVEGGAATLIVTPAGESVLIDTGMPGERDPQRIFKASKEAGIEQIDHLITTHFHIDHFGGAADLGKLMPIVNVWDNGIPEKNPDNPNDGRFARMIAPYREMEVRQRHLIEPGTEIPLKQAGPVALKLTCLGTMRSMVKGAEGHPNEHCERATEKSLDTGDNGNSTVFLLKYGNFEMFDGGDLTWNVEKTLACPVNLPGTVDVYDVNHHGLDSSNNPVLVRALAPTVAVMSNGTTKGCGAETFSTLKSTPSIQAIYQIHKNLRSDSENNTAEEQIANLERECSANSIKVSVARSGQSYVVSIPERGHSRTFQTR